MLGTARLLGQSTGAALVALMFNLAGQNGNHVALLTAGVLATLAAIVSGLRVTQPGFRHKKPGGVFSCPAYCVLLRYFRYSPLRSASIRLSSGG